MSGRVIVLDGTTALNESVRLIVQIKIASFNSFLARWRVSKLRVSTSWPRASIVSRLTACPGLGRFGPCHGRQVRSP